MIIFLVSSDLYFTPMSVPTVQAMTERSSGSKKVVQSQATMDKGMVSLGISKAPLSGGAPRASTAGSAASKVSGSGSAKKATTKPKPVRKPKTAYLLWKESELKAAKDNGGATTPTPTPAQWKALEASVRAPFETDATLDKARYEAETAAAAATTAGDDNDHDDAEPTDAGGTGAEGNGDNEEDEDGASTSKKQQTKKARFGSSVPTLTNIYRDIMKSAKREDEIVTMYEPRSSSSPSSPGKNDETLAEKFSSNEAAAAAASADSAS